MTKTIRIGRPFRDWLEGTQAWYDNLDGSRPDPLMSALVSARLRSDGSVVIPVDDGILEQVTFYAECLVDVASGDSPSELSSARAALRAVTRLRNK
jgi:hypothetical protein